MARDVIRSGPSVRVGVDSGGADAGADEKKTPYHEDSKIREDHKVFVLFVSSSCLREKTYRSALHTIHLTASNTLEWGTSVLYGVTARPRSTRLSGEWPQ
jgi:hypothetical protein